MLLQIYRNAYNVSHLVQDSRNDQAHLLPILAFVDPVKIGQYLISQTFSQAVTTRISYCKKCLHELPKYANFRR